MIFVAALRPIMFIPGLIVLIGIGVSVEFPQGFTGRTTDFWDAMANSLGVFVGAAAGLIARGLYVLKSGTVRLSREAHGEVTDLGTFKAGEGSHPAAPVIEALSEALVTYALRLEEAGVGLVDGPGGA